MSQPEGSLGPRGRTLRPRAWVLGLLTLAVSARGASAQGRVELISRASAASPATGVAPRGPSTLGDVSADGRYVAFASPAANLVAGQVDAPYTPDDPISPGSWDVFLRDRTTRKTTLVSHASSAAATGGLIGDGDDDSLLPALSADGRFVVFVSGRGDLVPGQSGEGGRNVFVWDRLLETTTLVSHALGLPARGTYGLTIVSPPVISGDGHFVAYTTDASGVVPGHALDDKILLYDRLTGANTYVDAASQQVRMSADGRFLVYYVDFQIWLYDRIAGSKKLVSHAPGSPAVPGSGQSLWPEISADGSAVVFSSSATDLVAGQVDANAGLDLFLYDRAADQTVLVSHSVASPVTAANGGSYEPALSADGRWVAFDSEATDLVSGGTDTNAYLDVFLYDRGSGDATLVGHAVSAPDVTGDRGSLIPRISADGGRVAFFSSSTDLVENQPDTAPWSNVFVLDRASGLLTRLAPTSKPGLAAPASLGRGARLSSDGRAVLFQSAFPLAAQDRNADWDLYLHDSAPFAACTLLDTRRATDGPAFRSGVRRALTGAGACAVPVSAKSILVDVTVLQSTGGGNLRFFPGNARVSPSAIVRFAQGEVRTFPVSLLLARNGAGTFTIQPHVAGAGTVHAILQVTGYAE